MKKKNPLLWLRFIATIIDFAIIYCITSLLHVLLYNYPVVNLSYIFVAVFILYYTVSYLFLRERTPAKMFVGIKVVKKSGERLSFGDIFLREIVLKGIVGLIIPLFVIEKLFPIGSRISLMFIVILITTIWVLSLIVLLLFKSTWWELFSQTRMIKRAPSSKRRLKYSFITVTILIVGFISLNSYPFIKDRQLLKTSFLPSYPKTKEVMQYADFLKQNQKNPVDYIFDLFKKYDVVVISERMHSEYTQYELFFKIIKDERFIKDVGNIFTECGSVSYQDTLTSYLHTTFESEEALNKSTANLQRNSSSIWPLWTNTNLFDFFKTINKLNSTLADNAKINWYFTDLTVDWNTKDHKKFQEDFTNPERDSLMAAHVLEKYNNMIMKQPRKKALVIMNTRHGYGLIDGRFGEEMKSEYNNGTTAFLMKKLPGKIANVMMNTVSMKYAPLYVPVQEGKWETAFATVNNPETGFDFTGSPFGYDKFDLAIKNIPLLTYKDVFTGFIFYKPLSQHFEKTGFPFEFDNFEDIILKRAGTVDQSSVDYFRKAIATYKQNPKEPTTSGPSGYAILFNILQVLIIHGLLIIGYIISLIFFIMQVRKPAIRTY